MAYPAIFRAVKADELSMVADFCTRWKSLSESCDVDASSMWVDRAGRTPLHFAQCPQIVNTLLDAGVNPNTADRKGVTPLHLATESRIVRMLLNAGANPNVADRQGVTPLHLAADAMIVQMLLNAGADPNAAERRGFTRLHVACNADTDAMIARLLLDAGANPNATNRQGMTPLHTISDTIIVRMLLDAGANVHTKCKIGDTPLHFAAWMGQFKIVRMLIDAGADVNARGHEQETPLSLACGAPNVVRLLLDAGAVVRDKMRSGDRLYYLSNPSSLRLLLGFDRGRVRSQIDPTQILDPHARGCRKERCPTILHKIARNTQKPDVIRMLIDAGADVNARDMDETTPLHWVWQPNCAVALIESGADVNAVDRFGRTPLDVAYCQKFTEIIRVLELYHAKRSGPGSWKLDWSHDSLEWIYTETNADAETSK